MTAVEVEATGAGRPAVLDEAHVGDIRGALGTIRLDDHAARTTRSAKLKTLLAVVGPGLIVMVGDNDAGAFSTYGQAGQVYGTKLLWTLLLLIPVLYVNQEMVLRLGAVTGVGHARLIMSRFGKFWGTFEVIDLFLLNALTIVTEFIGITLAAGYLGVPKVAAVVFAAAIIIATAFTGSFRTFERVAMFFCIGSLLLVPLYLMVHPAGATMLGGFTSPDLPHGAATGGMAAVMLLVIGIVGTTIAPWQLFFQQSYVIDKRITPRFIRYEKADLLIGIGIVIVGAAALMGTTAAAFAHHGAAFTDSSGIARGIAAYGGHVAGALFAVALLDAAVIGAFAVSLSSAYAIGDVFGMKHSLHRGVGQAKGFYALYAALICVAAAVVLIPGSPLGLITEGVQVLAGVLLPAATVFLLHAVQRQGRARPVGQHGQDQRVHRRGDHGADLAVGGAHRVGDVPGHRRDGDLRHHGGVRRAGGAPRRRHAGARPAAGTDGGGHSRDDGRGRGDVYGCGGRRRRPGGGRPGGQAVVAYAAAGRAADAGDPRRPPDRPARAALLPGHCHDHGGGEDRRDRDGTLARRVAVCGSGTCGKGTSEEGAVAEPSGPLAGVRVVELAGIGPGPFCGMLLADLGAEVICVDRPGGLPTPTPHRSDVTSRGKRRVVVDLKHPRGAEVVLRLAAASDALIEGYRPGVAERLGVGPADCLARNPALVYGRMTGWGQDGPLAASAGHDIAYIAVTGALHAIGRAGGPPQVPVELPG